MHPYWDTKFLPQRILNTYQVWQKEKIVWAGALLALATALKIYSIAFLPYIVFRKQWRLALVMIISIAIFFVGVPALYFGASQTVALIKQWITVVHSGSRPEYMLTYPAFKVSLAWMAVLLLNPQVSHGKDNLLNCSFDSIDNALHVAYLIWAILVVAYFVMNWRANVPAERKRLAFTLDISVLLFCFFPASPFLEPHHLIVLLVPAICLTGVMLARDFEMKYRIIAGSTLAASLLLTEAIRNPFRSVGVVMTLMVYCMGIYLIRRGLRLPPQALGTTNSEVTAPGPQGKV